MRKALAVVIISTVALTGCIPKDDRTYSGEQKDNFLAYVKTEVNSPAGDATWLKAGMEVCDALDNGAEVKDIVTEWRENDIDPAVGGPLLFASATYLCPDHEDKLNPYDDTNA